MIALWKGKGQGRKDALLVDEGSSKILLIKLRFFLFFFLFCLVSKVYTQHGAPTQDPRRVTCFTNEASQAHCPLSSLYLKSKKVDRD